MISPFDRLEGKSPSHTGKRELLSNLGQDCDWEGWIDTIYHRVPFVSPQIGYAGFGMAGTTDGHSPSERSTEDFGGRNWDLVWPEPILYPYDGQTGVPCEWDAYESPNPLRLIPGALDADGNPRAPTGTVISASFAAGYVRATRLDQASITAADGTRPEFWAFSSANDDRLTDMVSVIPKQPLAPDTVYTVHLSGTYTKGWESQKVPFDITWSFRTAQAGTIDSRMTTDSQGNLKLIVTGTNLASAETVFVAGLPRAFERNSDGSLTVAIGRRFAFDGVVTVMVRWPDGSLATDRRYWQFSSDVRIIPDLSDITAAVDRRGPVITTRLTYNDLRWLALDERLMPGARFQTIGSTHFVRYGDHIMEFADEPYAYVDGERQNMPAAAVTIQGVPYLPEDFLIMTLLRWNGLAGAGGSSSVSFRDISQHWARMAILRLAAGGIVSGLGDGTFAPDAALTRSAFTKMLVAARGLSPVPGETGGLVDVSNHWVSRDGYLGAAIAAGIIVPGEYAGGRFDPDRAITRDEIAVMVMRALGRDGAAAGRSVVVASDGSAVIGNKRFSDAAVWPHPGYVTSAIEQGIIGGYAESDGTYTFRAARTATRAEAVTMVVRMMDVLVGGK